MCYYAQSRELSVKALPRVRSFNFPEKRPCMDTVAMVEITAPFMLIAAASLLGGQPSEYTPLLPTGSDQLTLLHTRGIIKYAFSMER